MNSTIEKPKLKQLAMKINAEHAAAESMLRAGLQHALHCGELLMAAKKLVAHGGWLPWLKANCTVSERTAQAYMRVANHRSELKAKSATVADFEDVSFRQGLKLLAEPKGGESWRSDSKYIPPDGCLLRGRRGEMMVDIAPSEDQPGCCFVARLGGELGMKGLTDPVPNDLVAFMLELLLVDVSLFQWEEVAYPPWPSNIYSFLDNGEAALARWGKILNIEDDLVISDKQLSEWQQLAEIPDAEFEKALAALKMPTAEGVLNYHARPS